MIASCPPAFYWPGAWRSGNPGHHFDRHRQLGGSFRLLTGSYRSSLSSRYPLTILLLGYAVFAKVHLEGTICHLDSEDHALLPCLLVASAIIFASSYAPSGCTSAKMGETMRAVGTSRGFCSTHHGASQRWRHGIPEIGILGDVWGWL